MTAVLLFGVVGILMVGLLATLQLIRGETVLPSKRVRTTRMIRAEALAALALAVGSLCIVALITGLPGTVAWLVGTFVAFVIAMLLWFRGARST